MSATTDIGIGVIGLKATDSQMTPATHEDSNVQTESQAVAVVGPDGDVPTKARFFGLLSAMGLVDGAAFRDPGGYDGGLTLVRAERLYATLFPRPSPPPVVSTPDAEVEEALAKADVWASEDETMRSNAAEAAVILAAEVRRLRGATAAVNSAWRPCPRPHGLPDDAPFIVRNSNGFVAAATYVTAIGEAHYDTPEDSNFQCSDVAEWMPVPP